MEPNWEEVRRVQPTKAQGCSLAHSDPDELAFGDVDRLIEALIQVVRRELGLEPATILSRLARFFLDEFCIASSDL